MIYIVNPGDTVFSIAQQYGVTIEQLLYDNQMDIWQNLVVGQTLWIPKPDDAQNTEQVKRFFGYAYPFIQTEQLRDSLPHMDALYVFSYGFTTAGQLIPIDDSRLLSFAAAYNVEPVLVLTPFSESGAFNNQLVNVLVNDEGVQITLIDNLLRVAQEKGYVGIDVDFEFIRAEDKDAYVVFVERLTTTMNNNGIYVTVALPPKTSDDQRGLLYEGMDYAALGVAANNVLIMTYEWGYTYSSPQAVAPIPSVRRVLDYSVSRIPANKIYMGLPNYGYDWPLPYIRGATMAVTIGNIQAVRIAAENGAQIQFDETARSPFFNYTREGIAHEVWFEDLRSMQERFDIINEYGFVGGGYWNLMRPFRPNWLLQENVFG